jgi:hypothetical protein
MTTIKVDCETDEKLVKDMVCQVKPIEGGSVNITIGGTLIEPATSIFVRCTFSFFISSDIRTFSFVLVSRQKLFEGW